MRDSGTSFLITAAGALTAFLLRIALARVLGVEAYGDYAYVLIWINGPLIVLALHGFETASLRFGSAYRSQAYWSKLRGFLQHSQFYVLASSLLIAAILSIITWLLRNQLSDSLRITFWMGSLLLPLNSLLLLTSKQVLSFKRVAIGQSLYFLLRPGCVLLLVLITFGVSDLRRTAPMTMLINVLVVASLLILAYLVLRGLITLAVGTVRPEYEKKHWNRVGRDLMMIAGFAMIIGSADVIMLGALLGTATAGIYGAAVALVALVNLGLVAINSVIAPIISELYTGAYLKRLQELATIVAFVLSAYTVVIAVLLLIFGDQILNLFGPEFAIAYLPMSILLIGKIVDSVAGSVGFLLTMTGHQKDAMYILAAGSLISIMLNLILIPRYGMVGAAVATTLATIFWNSLMYVRVKQLTGIDPTLFHGIRVRI